MNRHAPGRAVLDARLHPELQQLGENVHPFVELRTSAGFRPAAFHDAKDQKIPTDIFEVGWATTRFFRPAAIACSASIRSSMRRQERSPRRSYDPSNNPACKGAWGSENVSGR